MKKIWIIVAAVVLIAGATGYALAQTSGAPQGGPGWMMGPGGGMMGGGTGWMAGAGMVNMMTGQALTQEQIEQFAKLHGITVDQAKQITGVCTQLMGRATTPQEQTQ